MSGDGGLLQPPVGAPEGEGKLQPLGGIRWPEGERHVPVEGEVALFDVTDPGELQDWLREDAPDRPPMAGETGPGRGIHPKGRNHG